MNLNKLEGSPFHPSLIFVGKAKSLTSEWSPVRVDSRLELSRVELLTGPHCYGRILALPGIIIQGRR
jgi:hypothetical protein